jgi:hypothetical protein
VDVILQITTIMNIDNNENDEIVHSVNSEDEKISNLEADRDSQGSVVSLDDIAAMMAASSKVLPEKMTMAKLKFGSTDNLMALATQSWYIDSIVSCYMHESLFEILWPFFSLAFV